MKLSKNKLVDPIIIIGTTLIGLVLIAICYASSVCWIRLAIYILKNSNPEYSTSIRISYFAVSAIVAGALYKPTKYAGTAATVFLLKKVVALSESCKDSKN